MNNNLATTRECLDYIKNNPKARFPAGWVEEVNAIARKLGLLPALAPQIGCNCKPGIDRGIEYGGDCEDVF